MIKKKSLIIGCLSVGFLILMIFIFIAINKASQRDEETTQTNLSSSDDSKKIIIDESKSMVASKVSNSGLKNSDNTSKLLPGGTESFKEAPSGENVDASDALEDSKYESNIKKVVEESWKEFEEQGRDTGKCTKYRIWYTFDVESKEWDCELSVDAVHGLDQNKSCVYCEHKRWKVKILKDNKLLNEELEKSGLQIVTSSNGQISITPIKCIWDWYDHKSENLQGIKGKSRIKVQGGGEH